MRLATLSVALLWIVGASAAAAQTPLTAAKCYSVGHWIGMNAALFDPGPDKSKLTTMATGLTRKFAAAAPVPAAMDAQSKNSSLGDLVKQGEQCGAVSASAPAATAAAPRAGAPLAAAKDPALPPGATHWRQVYASRPPLTELEFGANVGRADAGVVCTASDIVVVIPGPPPSGLGVTVKAKLYRLSGEAAVGEVTVGQSLGALKAFGSVPAALPYPAGTLRACRAP